VPGDPTSANLASVASDLDAQKGCERVLTEKNEKQIQRSTIPLNYKSLDQPYQGCRHPKCDVETAVSLTRTMYALPHPKEDYGR
jgi:hypothetical protein